MTTDRQLTPYWQTDDKDTVKLYHGDALETLKKMDSLSVHCIVTSPPYWGLRDYGSINELGSEKTPEEYISKMIQVFRGIRRVLRGDGTVWLNLGDTYSDNGQLTGIPWRVALALQADGWILRQDIIWSKPNPMPESIENRCTKAHEYIFLLTKQMGYYYDNESIKENAKGSGKSYSSRNFLPISNKDKLNNRKHTSATGASLKNRTDDEYTNSNKRSVWQVSIQPYSGSHFAAFPQKLIEPCIQAGTSEYGCCAVCQNPYKRGKHDKNGWYQDCNCETDDVIPCTVLDPFMGAATTAITALSLRRKVLGIELSEEYIRDLQIDRVKLCISQNTHVWEFINRDKLKNRKS